MSTLTGAELERAKALGLTPDVFAAMRKERQDKARAELRDRFGDERAEDIIGSVEAGGHTTPAGWLAADVARTADEVAAAFDEEARWEGSA